MDKPLLLTNEALNPNEQIVSPNKKFRVIYQGDGNLVVYDLSKSPDPIPDAATWHSRAAGISPGKCCMQDDGNLVLYNAAGLAYWESQTVGRQNAFCQIQDDGNFVIYAREGNSLIAVWDAWSDNVRRDTPPVVIGPTPRRWVCGWETIAEYDTGTGTWTTRQEWRCVWV